VNSSGGSIDASPEKAFSFAFYVNFVRVFTYSLTGKSDIRVFTYSLIEKSGKSVQAIGN
jgi:hypothetical protein